MYTVLGIKSLTPNGGQRSYQKSLKARGSSARVIWVGVVPGSAKRPTLITEHSIVKMTGKNKVAISSVVCPLLVVVVWLGGVRAAICDDVSLDVQNACRKALNPGQYPSYNQ